MDLKHQKSNNNNKNGGGKVKARAKPNKYLGVRQRPSGKWVAEIKNTTNKIRMWLGTFNTAEEAARAYDEAACLLRGSNTRTNFSPNLVSPDSDSPLSVKIRNLLREKKHRGTNVSSNARAKQNSPLVADTMTSCVSDSLSISQDVYKPDLSDCQVGSFCFDELCTFPLTDYQEMELQIPEMEFGFSPEPDEHMEITEFQRMRVERQISASLYAINGVNEYLENTYLSNDTLWDFPDSLGHLFPSLEIM